MIRDCTIGKNVVIHDEQLVNLYECEIGDNTKIGSFVEIQKGVKIGKQCKIQPFAFLPTGVVIEDGVFIGPHVVFTNDKYPKAAEKGRLLDSSDWKVMTTVVQESASIGANSTILCGVVIGKNSVIGAGSVVTEDVQPGDVVYGVKAKPREPKHQGRERE